MKYFATCIPGMEEIVKQDLVNQNCTPLDIDLAFKRGKVFFKTGKRPEEILKLRSIEHLYVFLSKTKVGVGESALEKLVDQVKKTDFSAFFEFIQGIKGKKFRVTASRIGKKQLFTSVDVSKKVAEEIYFKYGVDYDLKEYDYEFYMEINGEDCIVSGKCSRKVLRNKAYLKYLHPACLDTTIAYCMVLLSNPKKGDIVLDPMCGSGTLLIERALYFPKPKKLFGYDINKTFIGGAKTNTENAKARNISFFVGNGTKTELENGIIDVVISNLPFGKRIGSFKANKYLYDDLFKECSRVLRRGGIAVFLSTYTQQIKNMVYKYNLVLEREIKIEYGGLRPVIFVIKKRR